MDRGRIRRRIWVSSVVRVSEHYGIVLWDRCRDVNTDPTYVAEMRLHAVRMVAMKMFREHTEGMPIRAVAEQLGTSVSQIQRMMAGEANLAATIRALFLLGVPVKPVEAA